MTDQLNRSANNVPAVGYKRPPVHSRFKPGQSGNPSGRAKGSQNLKTLFDKIMKEQVQLREGTDVRKVSKAEAIMRGLVISAMKGDSRSLGTLFRLAEQIGQFEQPTQPTVVLIRRFADAFGHEIAGSSDLCKDHPS
jgi:hypothetical protein